MHSYCTISKHPASRIISICHSNLLLLLIMQAYPLIVTTVVEDFYDNNDASCCPHFGDPVELSISMLERVCDDEWLLCKPVKGDVYAAHGGGDVHTLYLIPSNQADVIDTYSHSVSCAHHARLPQLYAYTATSCSALAQTCVGREQQPSSALYRPKYVRSGYAGQLLVEHCSLHALCCLSMKHVFSTAHTAVKTGSGSSTAGEC
jgi:hypothetical protein